MLFFSGLLSEISFLISSHPFIIFFFSVFIIFTLVHSKFRNCVDTCKLFSDFSIQICRYNFGSCFVYHLLFSHPFPATIAPVRFSVLEFHRSDLNRALFTAWCAVMLQDNWKRSGARSHDNAFIHVTIFKFPIGFNGLKQSVRHSVTFKNTSSEICYPKLT
jgi:hypothetical protein